MPRQPDPLLDGRILEAAYRLWQRGGEKALTLRAVARTARTTTPTVYLHFRDKREILRCLRRRAQQELYGAVSPARSLAEFFRTALRFALRHPQEYRLLSAAWIIHYDAHDPTPAFDLLKRRLADRLGGRPSQHQELALGLAGLLHGAVSVLLEDGGRDGVAKALRRACLEGCARLVGDARAYRSAFRRE